METAIEQVFGAGPVDASQYSPLTLAYIGDGAYELVVRTLLVRQANAPVDKLNRRANALVRACTQARMAMGILERLSEEERTIYRRGRNAKSGTMAKNATVSEYRKATGFEALIGWLYLRREYDRMMELIRLGFEAVGAELRVYCGEDQ